MDTSPFLLAFLFFLAAAGGWLAASYSARRRVVGQSTIPPAEFFRGLDHLIREESDQAIDLLQSMADAEPGMAEVHFALATLFRKRGETDRAIRIHQNLLARPDLARRHREQALYDLAEDYHKAGLYDRAEALFAQLATQGVHKQESLQRLISIYERQRDWDQAIATRRRLAQFMPGEHDKVIAHYYCELASQARNKKDLVTMRNALKQARLSSRSIVRSALMRADLATLRDDLPLAVRLYTRVLESDPSLAAPVLERLHECFKADEEQLDEVLNDAIRRNPAITTDLAKAALATGLLNNRVAAAAARDLLSAHPTLKDLADSVPLDRVVSLLHSLGLARLVCRCHECGYQTTELRWQCPACQNWDSSRPDIRLKAVTESV